MGKSFRFTQLELQKLHYNSIENSSYCFNYDKSVTTILFISKEHQSPSLKLSKLEHKERVKYNRECHPELGKNIPVRGDLVIAAAREEARPVVVRWAIQRQLTCSCQGEVLYVPQVYIVTCKQYPQVNIATWKKAIPHR